MSDCNCKTLDTQINKVTLAKEDPLNTEIVIDSFAIEQVPILKFVRREKTYCYDGCTDCRVVWWKQNN